MGREFYEFVRGNERFLAFGFLLTFCSGFGQTFFIALFGDEIRAEFVLTHGEFGLIYSLANIGSAACLIWLGRQIDRVDLRLYSALSCVGLAAACLLMSAVPTAFLLGITLFALRLTGQGLLGHTSLTSMGRYFGEAKGRAVSIATLGFACSEAVFPSMGVGLKALVGWRNAWLMIGAALAVALVPLVLWLLKGHEDRHSRMLEDTAKACPGEGEQQWTVYEVLFDWRFYLVLPAVLAPAFIATGFFFHQVPLVHAKGWSLAWFAGCFVAYAAATVAAALLAGPIVDRTGAARLLPFYLLPLGAALLALATSDHPAVAIVYMLGVGFSMGAGFTILGVIWAEMYGVLHLGAIRSLVWALMVFAGALAPVAFGLLIDLKTTMETIAIMCLLYAVFGGGFAALALKRPRRLPSVT